VRENAPTGVWGWRGSWRGERSYNECILRLPTCHHKFRECTFQLPTMNKEPHQSRDENVLRYARRPRSCMRMINLTCRYFTLNFRCNGSAERAAAASGISPILLLGRFGFHECGQKRGGRWGTVERGGGMVIVHGRHGRDPRPEGRRVSS